MIDPVLESRLWFLLMVDHRCCLVTDDVYPYHVGRALRALLAAGMVQDERACWVPGPETEHWVMRTWDEIRAMEPTHDESAAAAISEAAGRETAAAQEALPAPAASGGAQAAGAVDDPTPTTPARVNV